MGKFNDLLKDMSQKYGDPQPAEQPEPAAQNATQPTSSGKLNALVNQMAKKYGVSGSDHSAALWGYDKAIHSAEGQAGWEEYQESRQQIAQAKKEAEENKTWFDKLGEYLGGVQDTSLPIHMTGEITKGIQEQDANLSKPTDDWAEDQKLTFGYLWKIDREKAWSYARSVNTERNQKAEQAKLQQIQNAATSNFGAGVGHTVGAVLTAPLGLADTMGDMIEMNALGHLSEADGEITPYEYAEAAKGGIAQNLNDKGGTLREDIPIVGGKGWGDVYGLGTSIAQSMLSAHAGGAGQALITSFGPAVQSGIESAKSRGATDEQAMSFGLMSGLVEALAEQVPADKLLKISSASTMKELALNILKQGAAEGLEEGITSIATNFADQLAMKDKSEYNLAVLMYMSNGISREAAQKKAWLEMAEGVLFDMLAGFTSGAVSGGIETGVKTALTALGTRATSNPSQSENAPTAAQTADQPRSDVNTAFDEAIARTTNAPADPIAAAVDSFRTGGVVTNKQAQDILNNTKAITQLLDQTGIKLPDTASGRRNAVKQAIAQLAQQQATAQEAADSAPFEAPKEDAHSVRTNAVSKPLDSAYLQKKEDVTQVPAEGQAANHEMNARSALASPSSNNSISHPAQNVNPSTESVGAAPGWFDPNTRLQYEYGTIPEGENPVRSDDLPKQDYTGGTVSRTARTVKGAEVTPDGFVDLLNKEVVEGTLSYVKITNNDTTQKAIDYITQEGWDAARQQWSADVRAGKAGADMVAVGALLLNNAAKAGDRTTWLDILTDYQALGTNTAQGLQALRILKTLKPSDKLYSIRRSIKQMVKDMHLDTDVTIDPELEAEYLNAETDQARDKVLKKIKQDVAAQLPATWMEKWNALRYVNMLGNFRTQVRNIAGNAGMKVASAAKNAVATALEVIANKASGGKFQRTKSLTVGRDLLKAAKADFDAVQSAVMGNGKYGDSNAQSSEFAQGVQSERRIFKNKALEGYRKITNWAMEQGDLIFSKSAYARALAGYLKANGVSGSDLSSVDSSLMDNARMYAIKEAQEATFRDSNILSDWISKVGRRKDTPTAVKVVSEGIMPFRKTPANVLIRAEEYSPLGIINSVATSIKAMQKDSDVTGAQVINSWAKTLTGTGIFGLGMLLNSLGCLTAGPDEDEDKDAFDSMNGWQNYALTLPDGTNLTIDFLTPSAMPLLMGAELMELIQDGGFELKDLESALTSIAEPMIQMSMLQGVNDTLENVQYVDNNLGQLLINSGLSYLTQGLTNTLAGQIERTFEDSRMTTYVDKDSALPAWLQRAIGKASAKIPGWDYQQIPYINAWGEEEENPEWYVNGAYNLLSPSYIEKGVSTALTQELNRLNEVQSDVNVYPSAPDKTITYSGKDHSLSAEKYVALAKAQGQTQKQVVEALISSADYSALSDAGKAQAIKYAYDYARDTARIEVLDDYPGYSSKWMEGINGNAAEAILRHTAVGTTEKYAYLPISTAAYVADLLKGIQKEAKADGTTYANVRDIQKMEAIVADDSLSKYVDDLLRDILDAGPEAKYDKALDAGYTAEQFVGGYRQYVDTTSEGKKQSVIRYCQREMGMSYAAAKKLYEIYNSKTTDE